MQIGKRGLFLDFLFDVIGEAAQVTNSKQITRPGDLRSNVTLVPQLADGFETLQMSAESVHQQARIVF